ncbi:MAG TPA: glycosyltransferase [Polyangiaceae bacterium]|jgi:glycosyltransferase involved in cell wall biosynthesis|nr:glycosyltransferase [Polyangiaceae bacterium]
MRIASTTLTANSASIIADALRSVVDWVDHCIVIDTGATDETLAVAREVAGEKLVERRFEWTNDFSAARNFALDAAHELGADWAVTLDTDERIERRGEDLRATLGATKEGVLMLFNEERSYAKERCFRLPMRVRYRGPTHEAFASYEVGARTATRAVFHELAKSAEQARKKFERDVAILAPYVRENPSDPRWHYYLGESLKHLERPEEAIAAYDACAELRGWNEESAWACYRPAECFCQLKRYRDAVERCARGLSRHAGLGELAWLAAFASFRAGDAAQAVYWAELSIVHGLFRGSGARVQRLGFRYPPALYEGPFDVLRYALRALGDEAGAKAAGELYEQALRARSKA